MIYILWLSKAFFKLGTYAIFVVYFHLTRVSGDNRDITEKTRRYYQTKQSQMKFKSHYLSQNQIKRNNMFLS